MRDKPCVENQSVSQNRAEQELARAKARLENTLNSITEGYYALDADWRFVAANRKAEQHFGRSAAQLIGQNLWELAKVAPDSLIYQKYHEAVALAEPVHFEASSEIRPGFWAELHLYPRDGMLEVYFSDISRRKKTEEALRESEKKYRELVQSAPAAIYEMDFRRQRFTQVNDAMCLMLGYSREELLAMHPMAILDKDGQAALQTRIRQWLAGETPEENIEYKVRAKDGRELWALLKARFTRDESGIPLGVTVIAHDITERRRMEEALRASQKDLNRAQAVANIGSWRLDIRQNEFTWSDENHRIFGIPKGTPLTYETFLSRVHPEDRDAVDAAWKAGLAGAPYDIEHRIVANGRIKWVREKAFPEWDQDRVLMGGFGITQDITARKQAEENLRWRAEELERLLETVPAAVWVAHDPQCLHITGNRRANEFYEAQVGENVSASALPEVRRFFTSVGRELPAEELPMQKACAANQDVRDEELHVLLPSGRRIALLGSAVPLRDQTGKVRGCIGAFLNITERRAAEEALREADRRKDEFLAMLAHELRNPLAPMRNAVHLLKMNPGTDKLPRLREILDRQVAHMARLLDDLLDVSRITRGRITLQKQPLPLPEILRLAVEAGAPAIQARNLTLAQAFPDKELWVEGDRDRLAQVFGNLLCNAAKYTPENGRIWLELDREAGEAVVRVRDNGQGIEPELMPRLFDLFVQGTPSSGSQGGLGIGLTMVKMLAAMHGGSVSAASPGPGQGSVFTVRLPLADPSAEHGRGCGAERPPRLSRRVLVVDDVADTAESLAEVLAAWGCETRTALDGRAALETARDFVPDAVLMDIGMPGMDGYQTARRLRKELQGEVLLVAISGYGQDQDRRKSREAGFDAHLVKPVDYGQLQRLLESR